MEMFDAVHRVAEAKKAYDAEARNQNLSYAALGRTLLKPEIFEFLRDLDRERSAAGHHDGYLGWLLHEMSRTRDYIAHNKTLVAERRRDYLRARLAAGEQVPAATLKDAGIWPTDQT